MNFFMILLFLASSSLSLAKLQEAETEDSPEITGSCGTRVNFILYKESGNMTIYGTGYMEDYTISNYDISEFYPYKEYIKNLFVEENVISIGDYAFYEFPNLQNLNFSESLRSIGYYSFYNCQLIQSVILPNITYLSSRSFQNCTSLSFFLYKGRNYDTTNRAYPFSDCTKLNAITVMYYYPYDEFYHLEVNRILPNETQITGDCGLRLTYSFDFNTFTLNISGRGNMSASPFADFLYYTKYVNFEGNITSIGEKAFQNFKFIESIKLPDSLIYIDPYSFYGCTGITTITIPNGTTAIDNSAFDCCKSLTSIDIPSTVTYIGSYAFYTCISLKSIDLSSVTNIKSAALYYCTNLTSFNIPPKIEVIPSKLLQSCSSLITVNIPNTIRIIDEYAFAYCSNLASIEFPDSVESIGDCGFINCFSLITLHIPKSMTSINESAFYNCHSIQSITVDEVASIYFGKNIFSNCTALSSFLYKGRKETDGPRPQFDKCDKLNYIDVLYYYNGERLSGILINRHRPDVAEIRGTCGPNLAYLFETSSNTLTVSGFGGMDYAPFHDFRYITEHIIIERNTSTIGESAFYSFDLITSVELPDTIEIIEKRAFHSCEKLEHVTISNGTKTIQHTVFSECKSLATIDIPESLTTLDEMAFKSCQSLQSIDLSSVTYIGYCLLSGCKLIKSVNISSVTYLGYGVFDSCSSLVSIHIPSTITSIQQFTFEHCSSLQSVIIDGNLTEIYHAAFYNCTSLTSFIYKGYNQPTFGIQVFSICPNLKVVDVMDYYEDNEFNKYNITRHSSFESYESSSDDETDHDETTQTEILTEEPSSIESETPNNCNHNAPVGCLICDTNDQSRCISCNTDLFFNETVDNEGKCNCLNNYKLNEQNQCVPIIGKCDQSAINKGCSNCYLYNQSICVECNESNGFNKEPTNENICQCTNSDFSISEGKCVELFVDCAWGDSQPVVGCKSCNGVHPNKCTLCDESKGFIISESNTCKCKNDGYIIDSQGQCVAQPSNSSNCNEKDMIGCIKCSDDNDHYCVTCDASKGFILKSDDSHTCVCEIEGYEVNEEGICRSPSSDTACSPNVQLYGCLECSSNNKEKCTLCDTSLNFNKNPTEIGTCTCINDYTLGVNGECFVYVEEKPVLSFPEYSGIEEIPTDCITSKDGLMTIDTDKIENKNDDLLYETKVDKEVTKVEIKNSNVENVQITINGRKDTPLDVVIEPDHKIQLNTSNSDFPINLPAKSQSVSIVVDSASSTLEVNSNENEAEIILGNISISKQSLVLSPKTDVTVEFVNLFGDSQISNNNNNNNEKSAKLIAKKVNLQKGSSSKISNVLISEELNLAPNSVATINEGVDFSLANFSIYKTDSQRMDYSYLDFVIEVKQYPKQIKIKEMESNTYLSDENDRIIILHQKSNILTKEMCNKWANQVDESSGYKGLCTENDSVNKGDNSVYAFKLKLPENPPENDPPKNNGGLNKAAKIGIAVAAVVVVVVVVIIVVIIVIKKKRSSKLSSEEDNHNDLTL